MQSKRIKMNTKILHFVHEIFIAPSLQKYLKRFQGKWLAAQLQALTPVPAPQPDSYVFFDDAIS